MILLVVMIPILFGLSDYFSGRLAIRLNAYAVIGATCAVSAVGAVLRGVAHGTLAFDPGAVVWGGVSGLLLITANALFFKALASGKGGVVGAIVTLSVIIPMLFDAFAGNLPSPVGTLGIVAIVVGVVLISLPEGQGTTSRQVVMLAAGAAAVFGFQYMSLKSGSESNPDMALLAQFIVGAVAVGLMGLIGRSTGNVRRSDLPALAGIGLMFLLGSLLFADALVTVNPAVASAFVNCEPIVLAACGYVILKERLSRLQMVALLVVIVGAGLAVLYN